MQEWGLLFKMDGYKGSGWPNVPKGYGLRQLSGSHEHCRRVYNFTEPEQMQLESDAEQFGKK